MADERPVVMTEPCMRFGQPHIGGTSVDALAGMVWAGEPVAVVAEEYGRTVAEVLVACWHQARYGTRAERKRWAAWLETVEDDMWHSRFDNLPAPPNRRGE